MAGDRGVDLRTAHTLVDVGVLGDRLQGDMRYPLVHEALADVAAGRSLGCRLTGQLSLFAASFG